MADYVWQHALKGERDCLRLMSDLLDPSSEFRLLRIGVATGGRCLEIGAGNGSLSQSLAQRAGPAGQITAPRRGLTARYSRYRSASTSKLNAAED